MKKLFGISCIIALFACTQSKITGTIDSTDTGIVGKVTYSIGTAASNAQVKLFGARDTSRTALSQRNTDNSGNYKFDSLTSGSYNVWIESSDSLVAFIDSIYVPKNTLVRRDAILGKSGSITAIVGLQPGHDPQSVSVQALGTQKYSNVGASGFFTIPRLAEGEYTLRLVSTIAGYTPTYKTITVSSGVDDTLKDTIKLIYTGIPPVAGITAHYNPFIGVATVSWNAMAYANLYDYLIYRDIPGSINLSTVPIAASIDTVYYDTLFGNPASIIIGWPNSFTDTSNIRFKYRYRVTIRNKANQEGAPYEFADINGTNPLFLMHVVSPDDNAEFVNGTNLSVSWNAAPAAQNYQVHISSKPDFLDTVFIATIIDTVKALPELALGYYYVHIRAQGPKAQWGFWSVPSRFLVNGGLFAKTFGQTEHFGVDKLLKANDGGYLMVGMSSNPNSKPLYCVKTDSNGTEEWHQSFTLQESYISQENALEAIQTDDNGYLILGKYTSFLLKINSNGTTVWSKTNNDTNTFSAGMSGTSILKTPDGGFIMGAVVSDTQSYYNQAHILKFNGSGLKQWDRMIGTTKPDGPHFLPMGADSFAVLYLNPSEWYTDTLIISMFDYSGNAKISKRIKIPQTYSINSVCETNKGEIVLSACTDAAGGSTNFKISADMNNASALEVQFGGEYVDIQPVPDGGFVYTSGTTMIKANETGAIIWSKTIASFGALPFVVESDGSIVAASSLSSNYQNTGALLFKISKDGISFEQ